MSAQGGRYQYKDDWQFYDTLTTNYNYPGKMITWEGHSCDGMKLFGRDRGAVIAGTTGKVVIDRDGYDTYNREGEKTGEFRTGKNTSTADVVGSDSMPP